jgi:hypothetical protein
MTGQFAQSHGLGMGLPGEIGVIWNGFEHFAGSCGFAVKFGNKLFLNVHCATSFGAKPA